MTVKFSAWGNSQFVDSTGAPAVGWKIETYVAGSSTPATTYTTSAGNVQQSNPIVLNALGLPTVGQIWLTEGVSYKLVLTNAAGTVQKTEDNISGVNDSNVSQDEWVSGPAPTYIGATSFSLVGDQTGTFQVGRRVKTTNSGGTIYSTITVSAFAAVTTITVVNDSGTLDSGLSAVSYGLLSATGPSVPNFAGPSSNSPAPAGQLFMRGGQIGFPAVQIPSTDANTLDDYEEASFTLADGSGSGPAITNTSLSYTKIGRLLVCQFDITFGASADGANAKLTGLPVTSNNSNRGGGFINNTDYVSTSGLNLFVNPNSVTFQIYDGPTALTNANCGGKTFAGTVIYTP
jgi:hypothetical protein